MPPNPPEDFSNGTAVFGTDNTATPTFTPKRTPSKRRPINPYKGAEAFQTHADNPAAREGPRIDTEFVVHGYQQRDAPTRRSSTFTKTSPTASQPPGFSFTNDSQKQKGWSYIGLQRTPFEIVSKEMKPPSPDCSAVVEPRARISSVAGSALNSLNSETLKFIVYCLLWYASSAVTNNIGKQILNHWKYPVTLTWVQFGFVGFYCYLLGVIGFTSLKAPTKHIIRETSPLSCFQILGHVFSSIATSKVPVSFVHTIKALSPLFTVFAYRIGFGVNYASPVYISLVPLTIGVMLACSSSSTSNLIGFLFAIGSTVIFVAQNVFSKALLRNQERIGYEKKKLDKLNLMFYSSVIAFVLMTPMWLYSEGFHLLGELLWTDSHHDSTGMNSWTIAFYVFFNGATHFAQNVMAFSILAITSPVTYSIASLVKRIFVITASIIWFGQRTTFVQGVGIFLTFTGLYMYNNAKRDVERKEQKARDKEEIILPLTRSNSELEFKKM